MSNENCKTLMKEIEEDSKNKKNLYVHELEELILLKYPYCHSIPIKIPMTFSTEIGEEKKKTLLKFVWNHKKPFTEHICFEIFM
jgi:hypothetical protein